MTTFAGTTQKMTRLGNVQLALTRCDAGLELPRHHHEHAFLSFLLDGEYSEGDKQQWRDCHENTVTWHPRNDQHAVRHGTRPVTSLQVEFLEDEIEQISIRHHFPALRTSARMPSLRYHIQSLVEEINTGDEWSEWAIRGGLLQIFSTLGRYENRQRGLSPESVVSHVNAVIEDACPETPDEQALTSGCGAGISHVAAIYRQMTGESIASVVRRRRISRACELLTTKDMPLAEVAVECGFYDQSHFTRMFSKLMKCTPGHFRRLQR